MGKVLDILNSIACSSCGHYAYFSFGFGPFAIGGVVENLHAQILHPRFKEEN